VCVCVCVVLDIDRMDRAQHLKLVKKTSP